MNFKPYLLMIFLFLRHFKLKRAYGITNSPAKFQKKKELSKSLLHHMSWNYDSCSRRASNERPEPKVVLIVLS